MNRTPGFRSAAYERGDLVYHLNSQTYGIVIEEDEVYHQVEIRFLSGETITIAHESLTSYWLGKALPESLSNSYINVTLEDENEKDSK